MLTTILAKAREHFGLPPNASLSQLDAAMEADTTTEVIEEVAAAGADKDTEAAPETVAETATEAPAETISRADVATMIAEATTAQAQAIADLNEANAELSARLKVVEGADADSHTGGKKEAIKITAEEKPLYAQNPINQAVAQRLAGKK